MGANVKTIRNRDCTAEEVAQYNPKRIVISPGPGCPSEAGISKVTEILKLNNTPNKPDHSSLLYPTKLNTFAGRM
jgi:anthranilate/para-aminobenzoate synthase component II